MANTTRIGIPKIEGSDLPRMDIHVNAALDHIDAHTAIDLQGPLSTRPSAGVPGRYFTAIDQTPVSTYRDNGSSWDPISNNAPGSIDGGKFDNGSIILDKVTPKSMKLTWNNIPLSHLYHPIDTGSAVSGPCWHEHPKWSIDPFGIVRFSGSIASFYTLENVAAEAKLIKIQAPIPLPMQPQNFNTCVIVHDGSEGGLVLKALYSIDLLPLTQNIRYLSSGE